MVELAEDFHFIVYDLFFAFDYLLCDDLDCYLEVVRYP
jgi:hypothetical protein